MSFVDGVKTKTAFDWADVKRHPYKSFLFIFLGCFQNLFDLMPQMVSLTCSNLHLSPPHILYSDPRFAHLPLRFSSVSHPLAPSFNYLYDTFSTAFRLWSNSSISFFYLISLTFSFLFQLSNNFSIVVGRFL